MKKHIQSCYMQIAQIFRRLDVVIRLNRDRHLIDESVASHSFHVTWMVYLVCIELEELGMKAIDTRLAFEKALFHDLGEAATGDIIFPTKKFDPKMDKEFKRLEKEMLEEELPEDLPRYLRKMVLPGEPRKEDVIVKACDMMELLFHLLEERRAGNTHLDLIFVRGLDVSLGLWEEHPILRYSPMYKSWLEEVAWVAHKEFGIWAGPYALSENLLITKGD